MRLTAVGTLLAALALGGCQRVSKEDFFKENPIPRPHNEVSESPVSVYQGPMTFTYLLTVKQGTTESDVRKELPPFEVYPKGDNKFEIVPKEGVTLEEALKEIPKLPGLEVIDIKPHSEPVIYRSPKDILMDEMMEAWCRDDMKEVERIGRQIEEIEFREKEAQIYRDLESGILKL